MWHNFSNGLPTGVTLVVYKMIFRISRVIRLQGKICRFQILSVGVGLFHDTQNSSFNEKQSFADGRLSFMTSWHVFLSDSNIFGQEIYSLDKFWFHGPTQTTFKPLVWHLLHQNILIINDFMKVYEKLIIIFNIFWWKKCLTIGLKLFWVDLYLFISHSVGYCNHKCVGNF